LPKRLAGRSFSTQTRRGNFKISFAAKNAKSAKKSYIMVFNLRVFASFAAIGF
jgi:hypothetical protein